MFKNRFKIFLIIFFPAASIIFSSCANLDHINKYAINSAEGVENFHDINFSFQEYCNFYQGRFLTLKINTTDINLPKPSDPDCKAYALSDSALQIFHNVLLSYFNSLTKVSDQKLIDYKLDDAVTNLKSFRDQVKWKINDDQLSSAQNIITKVLNHLMDHYRRAKIKKVLNETRNDLPNVIDAYSTSIQALAGLSRNAFANYKQFYISALLERTSDPSVKVLIVEEFNRTEIKFNEREKMIDKYLDVLNKIKEGYKELAANSNKLTSVLVKEEVKKYADDLEEIKEQIRALSKKM